MNRGSITMIQRLKSSRSKGSVLSPISKGCTWPSLCGQGHAHRLMAQTRNNDDSFPRSSYYSYRDSASLFDKTKRCGITSVRQWIRFWSSKCFTWWDTDFRIEDAACDATYWLLNARSPQVRTRTGVCHSWWCLSRENLTQVPTFFHLSPSEAGQVKSFAYVYI